jgi:hypothetical protein
MYKRKKGVCKDGDLEVPRRERWRRRLGVPISSVANIAIAVDIPICVSVGMSIRVAVGVSIGIPIPMHRINRRNIAPEVLLALCRTIAHPTHTSLFGHLHLCLRALAPLTPNRRQEVHEETEDVTTVDKRDTPLQTRRNVPHMFLAAHAKRDNHANLQNDKRELDPEAVAQDRVLAVPYAEALVLPANEDRGDDVATDEDAQEDVVQFVVVLAVEDGEEDEACGAGDGGDGGAPAVHFLPDGGVGCEFAGVAQVALKDEGEGEGYDGHGGHGDEHGFEGVGADILGGVSIVFVGCFEGHAYQRCRGSIVPRSWLHSGVFRWCSNIPAW